MDRPLTLSTPAWSTGHDVQFYETEGFLVSCVAEFLGAGIKHGQPMVVIATEPHRMAFEASLREMHPLALDGMGTDIVWLEARDTLSGFMVNGMPNRERFEATVGAVFARIMATRNYLVLRAYGEMVDILWGEGNFNGALAVEKLWNELGTKYRFHLLCAYSMGNFFKETTTPGFKAVCDYHGSAATELRPN
jgi:hypothetical protein